MPLVITRSECYQHMKEVAKANGFESITSAIAFAVKSRKDTELREDVEAEAAKIKSQAFSVEEDRHASWDRRWAGK